MNNDAFNRAQANWDNMLPPDNDPPDTPEHLILQICQEWAEDPPDWMREKADDYWIAKWEENRNRRRR